MLIVSKKGNPITRVIIKAEGGKELAQFEAIGGKSSKEFSLKDLSLENFSCTEGGSFMFETDKVYLIDPFPQGGDRVIRQTIKIKVEPDGSIVELKY